jgi:D-lactate dehydrogenase
MKIAFFDIDEKEKEAFFNQQLSSHQLIFSYDRLSLDSLPKDRDQEILSLRSKSEASKKVLENFPNLKLVALRTTGFDNVDLDYCKEKGILVCNVPSYGSHTVAEFAIGLLLSLSRKIPQALDQLKKIDSFNQQGLRGFEVFNKTLGVVGTGKIGANVIRIARGLGMKVIAFDVFKNEKLQQELGFEYVELEKLLQQSDVISIHAPATKETYHLINKDNISKIKKGAVLINTARGSLVETAALLEALDEGIISQAGLDVLEEEADLTNKAKDETQREDLMLINHPKVLVTPHIAFYTKEAEQTIGDVTVENIESFLKGNPQNLVN